MAGTCSKRNDDPRIPPIVRIVIEGIADCLALHALHYTSQAQNRVV